MVKRINAIAFAYAGVLSLNTLNIQLIGSGIGIFSCVLKRVLTNFKHICSPVFFVLL